MMTRLGLIGGFVLATSVALGAQSPPPVEGLSGASGIEGAAVDVYDALNLAIVQAIDGVEHVAHFARTLFVHGGRDGSVDGLAGLKEGRAVIVRYPMTATGEAAEEIDRVGDAASQTTEDAITRVDRRRQRITIRFADGTSETLQLTDQAAPAAGRDRKDASGDDAKVVVYYADEAGGEVAHYFTKVS